jgi:hypothetical protein
VKEWGKWCDNYIESQQLSANPAIVGISSKIKQLVKELK